MGNGETGIQFNEDQKKVIEAAGGHYLVLAPPGCGKTQMLTERIVHAHQCGIDYSEMVCLTFTNRAARGMTERIAQRIGDQEAIQIFVGNVHRFCSKFLFENSLIAPEASVIDEDDAISILAHQLNEDEHKVTVNNARRREYATVFHLANMMHQIRHAHPKNLRIHPECINRDDIFAMRRICEIQRMEFNAKAMLDIYDDTDTYREICRSDAYDYAAQKLIAPLLRKMALARHYENYKRQNQLFDFEDLLLHTYDALTADTDHAYKRYSWIQVDEVQDLNPLQLAIIDLITAPPQPSPEGREGAPTVIYLGDEQQAIFSFMGAKTETLNMLKDRCKDHIMHLTRNYRSPDYLLEVYNKYATDILKIDRNLLPDAVQQAPNTGDELRLLSSSTYDSEVRDVAEEAGRLAANAGETTAIIVGANADADIIGKELERMGLSFFKVSGADTFASADMKLLLAHLTVASADMNFIAWARLLKGMHVFETSAAARNFVRASMNRAILPSDYLLYEGSTYVMEFLKTAQQGEIVVFDTETTGLDVYKDDIIQIAATKMRHGKVVDHSDFCLHIDTDLPIPAMLGDTPNPIIEERRHAVLHPHGKALKAFLDYAGQATLLAHNADFDYRILEHNLKRYLPEENLRQRHPHYFDSLRLIRLLEPAQKAYKLKALLQSLGLEGTNSHLADDDVRATCNLVSHCIAKAAEVVGAQRAFMQEKRVTSRVETLRRNYAELYFHTRQRLFNGNGYHELQELHEGNGNNSKPSLLTAELNYVYRRLLDDAIITPIPNIKRITGYLDSEIIDQQSAPALIDQLHAHIIEIGTLKEADLISHPSSLICHPSSVIISTVHKAKGLEFDNVIVFDAVDGRYPNFYSQNIPDLLAEDARKFYVAISRARKRLVVAQSLKRIDYHNQPHKRELTRFMKPILKYFN